MKIETNIIDRINRNTREYAAKVRIVDRALPSQDHLQRALYSPPKLRVGVAPVINGAKSDGRPWFSVKNEAAKEAAEITIYDQIGKDWWSGEGTDAKEFSDALKAIDANRPIKLFINSPGGNVYDGIAIYNLLRARKARVDTYNIGLAASIASVILLATANGGQVHVAKTSQTMIHRASTVAMGGVKEMQQAINALESAEKSIVIAYIEKTGKAESELSDAMEKETWLSGNEAKDFGFADEVTDAAPISNSFDLSNFRRVPESFRKMQNTALPGGQQNTLMNRQQIIARLKKLGATVDDNATDEQLIAQLDAAIEARQSPAPTPLATAAAVPGASAPASAEANRIAALEQRYENERRERITARVDALITDRRVQASERDFLITEGLRDERHITNAAQRPQVMPPEGVPVECVSESAHDISNHALMLGGHRDAPRNAVALASFLRKNSAKLIGVWNEGTNTIDSALKQDLLLESGMRAFKKHMMALSAFSTKFENVPLRGTNKVVVPFFSLQTAASTDFVAANGYVAGDTSTGKRDVTVNKRKYQALSFTSEELRRQPFLGLNENMTLNAEKLAYDVQQNILSEIVAANFATVGFTGLAGSFDSNVIADLQLAATTAQWPFVGRSLFVNSSYDNALKKDNALKLFFNSGSNSVLVQGQISNQLYGFTYNECPNLPGNSENLVGFIAFKSAMLIATAPIQPTEEVIRDGTQYSVMADPDGGPALEMRKIGDSQKDKAIWVVECNYGYDTGNENALQRIRSAA